MPVSTLKKGGTVGMGVGNNYPVQTSHWEIDIAKAVAAGLVTTDYVVIQTLPANTYFRLLQVQCVDNIVLGSGAAISVGDSGSATRFVNAAATLTAGTNLTLAAQVGSPEVYGTANELRMTVTGASLASTTGKIRFVYQIADTSRLASASVQAT